MNTDDNKNNPSGHRKRLKERFIDDKENSFSDSQLLELLLHYSIPRKDTAQIAAKALTHFGSIESLLNAPVEQIVEVSGMGQNTAILIELINRLKSRSAKSMRTEIYINSISDAVDFINTIKFNHNFENFYIIGLSKDYELLKTKLLSTGNSMNTQFNLKDIIRFAVSCDANYIILTHNHPDGNFKPSKEDIELTNLCASYLKKIEVHLIDHIITSETGFFSFAIQLPTDGSINGYRQKQNT